MTGVVKSETIGRSYEETMKVFQLKKAWASFVFGVKNPQTITFKVGVFIFTQGERNLWNFAYQTAQPQFLSVVQPPLPFFEIAAFSSNYFQIRHCLDLLHEIINLPSAPFGQGFLSVLPLSVVSHETPCDSSGEHLWAAGVNNVLIKKVYLSTTMSFVFYTYFIILSIMIMIVII